MLKIPIKTRLWEPVNFLILNFILLVVRRKNGQLWWCWLWVWAPLPMLLFSAFIIAAVLPPIVIFIAYSLRARSHIDREKASPFECGFDPKNKARIPFSTRFFLLAVIFLVFDVEIVLLIPAPIIIFSSNFTPLLVRSFIFLIILILGLLHEWNEGSLSWAK